MGGAADMDSSWQRFAVITAVAVVALLVASNVLLLTLVLRDDGAEATEPASAQTALPQLPAASSGGSSKALLKELDKTKREIKDPLSRALADLSDANANAATLGELPALLQQMVAYSAALEYVAPELESIDSQMRSLNKNMKSMTGFVNGTGAVLVDLERSLQAMQTDIARIRECTEKPDSCK